MSRLKGVRPKVAQIGIYPPPYGGISIHIQRLKEQLEQNGYECVVYDLGGEGVSVERNVIRVGTVKRRLLRRFFFSREDIIHCHISSWRMRVMIGILGLLGKKTVISVHGESLNDSLKEGGWLRRQIIKFALKRTSFIIADNEKIENLVLSLGVKRQNETRIPAFIPPTIKEGDNKKVPQYVWDFISTHTPVISANAFQISFYDGVDTYGLDMIVELADKLRNKYPELGVVICLPVIGDEQYFSKLNGEIKERNLNEQILFVTEPLDEVYPIWQASDIFVRPTVTDGDALSVREALYLKTPVVTSDACPRPEGVVIFKNRDIESFTVSVEKVLDDYSRYEQEVELIKSYGGVDKILEIYDNLVKAN